MYNPELDALCLKAGVTHSGSVNRTQQRAIPPICSVEEALHAIDKGVSKSLIFRKPGNISNPQMPMGTRLSSPKDLGESFEGHQHNADYK